MTKYQHLKETITTGLGTEGSLLIPKTIAANLIIEKDRKTLDRVLAAQFYGPSTIRGSSIDVGLEDTGVAEVNVVGEGGPVPLTNDTYSSTNIKPLKYGGRPLITREMVEDSMFPLIEHNIRKVGRRLAENETGLILTQLDGATNVVAGGAAITYQNLTRAQQYLRDNDYEPTDLLVGPEFFKDLTDIDTFVEANKWGGVTTNQTGALARVLGMNIHLFSANIGTTTSGYIIDRNEAYAIAEKRPVSIERYDDKVHDLMGVVATQRIAVKLLRDTAVARITSS